MKTELPIPLPRITWRGVALASVGWVLYSLAFAAYSAQIVQISFPMAVFHQLQGNLILALLSIPIWLLTVRRMDQTRWGWKVAVHALIAPLYAVSGFEAIAGWVHLMAGPTAAQQMRDFSQWTLWGFFFTYLVQFSFYHIARSAQKIRWRERQAAELLALTREQELAILKAQLNPHFLFNTLNGISAMVSRDPEEARRMIARLADLLRYATDSSERPLVPLREEVAFTQAYVQLEQKRLAERLSTELDIDSEALDAPIPPMILQSLVENAIKHGIAPAPEGGKLLVQIRAAKGLLRIGVRDTGIGVNGRSLEELKVLGTGLKNSDERLRHLFGQEAQLRLQTPADGGFQIDFALPLEPK